MRKGGDMRNYLKILVNKLRQILSKIRQVSHNFKHFQIISHISTFSHISTKFWYSLFFYTWGIGFWVFPLTSIPLGGCYVSREGTPSLRHTFVNT
jgi:hypothetical protein